MDPGKVLALQIVIRFLKEDLFFQIGFNYELVQGNPDRQCGGYLIAKNLQLMKDLQSLGYKCNSGNCYYRNIVKNLDDQPDGDKNRMVSCWCLY